MNKLIYFSNIWAKIFSINELHYKFNFALF